MIRIASNISFAKIEDLYKELKLSEETTIDLHLPIRFQKIDFGLLFSYLQFFATWLRDKRSGKLCLPVETTQEAIDYLDQNEFVYPSIVMAWEKEIVNNKMEDIRIELKTPSKAYFQKMDFFELKGTSSVPIYCFDHDKSDRGFSRHFYNVKRELIPEDGLGFNLYRAFQKIGSLNHSVFRNSMRKHMDSFIAIIHELFTNTHDHAKTNELGYNIYPNIRATQLKFHRREINKLIEEYKQFQGLKNYFSTRFNLNAQNELYLVEISVLDSGPGLVKRYTGTSDFNLSINDEVAIIKECLYRHNTSVEYLKGDNKGIGLDRVLQTLNGKGFIRIKTGRADVFRDMKSHQYKHHEQACDIQLNDWHSNDCENFQISLPAEGTLISIFYPIDYQQG